MLSLFFLINLFAFLVVHSRSLSENSPKVAFITAIYGGYEKFCKDFKIQSVATDFFCFTDDKDMIVRSPWIVDSNPYHMLYKSRLDNDSYINSLDKNKNSFNIAKYYKQSFQNIPRLKDYDVVVWIDGTIEITSPNVSQYILDRIQNHSIITWNHPERKGSLKEEAEISMIIDRYDTTILNGHYQPYQNVTYQYHEYIKNGYNESYFQKEMSSLHFPNQQSFISERYYGVWVTCFVAFSNKDPQISQFLDFWYLQTLNYTTQDQVSFPYALQKFKKFPLTLPDDEDDKELIQGNYQKNNFFIKHKHLFEIELIEATESVNTEHVNFDL